MSVDERTHTKALARIENLEEMVRTQKESIFKLENLVSQLRLRAGGGATGGASASEGSDWDRLATEERERRRKNLSRKSAKARSSSKRADSNSNGQKSATNTGTASGGATPGSGNEDSWSETGSEGSYSVSDESSWDSDTVPYGTKSKNSSPSPPRGTKSTPKNDVPPPAPAPETKKAPAHASAAPPSGPTLTEDEIVANVKVWSRGKDVVDMIRSLKEVYHGSNLIQLDAKYMDPRKTLNAKECRVAFLRICKSIHPDKQAHESESVKIEAKVIFEVLHNSYEMYNFHNTARDI